jgi:hypothetical protein
MNAWTSNRCRATAALLTVVGIAALAGALAAPARAEGLTPALLVENGWTCGQAPPFIVPARITCFNRGLGHPVLGAPDRPSHMFLVFDLNGNFMGTQHLIRFDLYRNQPCGPGGEPYIFRPGIGYYECLRA